MPPNDMKFTRFVIYVATTVGFVAQLYYITAQYLAYETVNSVAIERPMSVVPPQVAICFRFYDFFSFSFRWFLEHGNEVNITVAQLASTLPAVDEILNGQLVHNHDDYMDTAYTADNYKSYFTTRTLYKHRFYCYTFAYAREAIATRYLTNSLFPQRFFDIELNGTLFNQSYLVTYYLRPHDGDFSGLSDTMAEISRSSSCRNCLERDNGIVVLSYNRFRSQLLPRPYESDCINYNRFGFTSR